MTATFAVAHVRSARRETLDKALKSASVVIAGDAATTLRMLPADSVDAIVTSPPYWGVRDYGMPSQIGMEDTVGEYIRRLTRVFSAAARVLKDDGVLWINIGDVYSSGNRTYRAQDGLNAQRGMSTRPRTPAGLKQKDLVGLPWRLMFALQKRGWYLRSEIIWKKTNPMPESVRDRPWRVHESLFLLSKGARYSFRQSALLSGDTDARRTVWEMAAGRSKVNGHSAVFPDRLVRPCIAASTRRGQVVLDPFCGTGTVGRVCIEEGRKFVGIELNSGYATAAVRMLTTSRKKKVDRRAHSKGSR